MTKVLADRRWSCQNSLPSKSSIFCVLTESNFIHTIAHLVSKLRTPKPVRSDHLMQLTFTVGLVRLKEILRKLLHTWFVYVLPYRIFPCTDSTATTGSGDILRACMYMYKLQLRIICALNKTDCIHNVY